MRDSNKLQKTGVSYNCSSRESVKIAVDGRQLQFAGNGRQLHIAVDGSLLQLQQMEYSKKNVVEWRQ